MRKWVGWVALAAALALSACSPPAKNAAGALNIYNWSDYIDPVRHF